MSFPPFIPPSYGVSLLPVYSMASKSHRSITGPQDLGPRALWVSPGPFYCFLRGVCPSDGVKQWFEALTGKFLPFVVSYISHFICSYNLNYNFRPLRGPSIILISVKMFYIQQQRCFHSFIRLFVVQQPGISPGDGVLDTSSF